MNRLLPTGLCLLLLLLFASKQVAAQAPVNADSLFRQAQKLAHDGNYAGGRELAWQVLQEAPTYTDALLLVGNTLAWEQQYDSARAVLSPLVMRQAATPELYLLLANIELWDHQAEQALTYATAGLQAAPTNAALELAKVKALHALHRDNEAREALAILLKHEPANSEARAMREKLQKTDYANLIRAEHQVTTFDEDIAAWQLSSLAYTRSAHSGKYVARVNRAQRYAQQSLQAEVDAYPRLGDKMYAYLNVGVSDQALFPDYRAGLEIYRQLPQKFEVSAGARALVYPSETVMLFTGYVGKYFHRQWVSFRPFLQKQGSGWQTTGILQVRQYLRHDDAFISLLVSKGSMPSVQIGFQEISRLDATRVGLEGQFRLNRLLLGSTLAYEREEYQASSFRNRLTAGLSVGVKF